MNPVRTFSALPIDPTSKLGRPLRICIASPDFVGPIRNGGIGTAYTSMADALASAGHDVTCLYSGGVECAAHDIDYWVKQYAARNVKLAPMPHLSGNFKTTIHATRSFEALNWLKQQGEFDYIHFPEWQGLGYYSTLAKKQGLAFENTTLCVGIHSMTAWIKEGAQEHLNGLWELQMDFMERESVRLADVVISPSQYLLNWIADRGWQLPQFSFVQQNIMPRSAKRTMPSRPDIAHHIDELVFFGRLETRKGIHLFCDALDRMPGELSGKIKQVTFLGKDSVVDGTKATTYIRRRAERWNWPVQVLTDCNQPEALEYLGGKGRLGVIPSQMENSPYTVHECLGAGIPFIANHVGGIPELIAPEDVTRVCFVNKPQAVADKLAHALKHGHHSAHPALSADSNEKVWVAWHETHGAHAHPKPTPAPIWPKVSVCVTTFNRPGLLRLALASIEAQTYSNYEVIVVDDGSTQPEAIAYLDSLTPRFAARGWQVVRQSNRYLGAARNEAARHATGEYLLFMDDDNVAEPHELAVFAKAAVASGADILTCGMNQFVGDAAPDRSKEVETRWLPLGPSAAVGALTNCFGDANSLVRRSCFERLGGFTEDYGVTHEDWEFLAKAVLKGFTLQVVPEFLFWYRVSPDSMYRTLPQYPNFARSIRPYVDAVPAELRTLVLYAQGLFLSGGGGSDAKAWAVYTEFTVRWRSKLEAGLALAELGQVGAAMKLMMAGIKAVESCKDPRVLLEALLEIAPHLARFDAGRARFLLGLAADSAKQLGSTADHERALSHLAKLSAPVSRVPTAPMRIATPQRLSA